MRNVPRVMVKETKPMRVDTSAMGGKAVWETVIPIVHCHYLDDMGLDDYANVDEEIDRDEGIGA